MRTRYEDLSRKYFSDKNKVEPLNRVSGIWISGTSIYFYDKI